MGDKGGKKDKEKSKQQQVKKQKQEEQKKQGSSGNRVGDFWHFIAAAACRRGF